MTDLPSIKDESGVTIIELLVGISASCVILFAISGMVITSLHQTARVSARVEATQRARIAMTNMMEELHSACVAPQIAPVREGSTGTSLVFFHQAGGGAILTPTKSRITLNEGTLKQEDFEAAHGSGPPEWEFGERPSSERQLLTGVSATSPSSAVFTYYAYTAGQLAPTVVTVPSKGLTKETASQVVEVGVAFTAGPLNNPVSDPDASASVSDRAVLRLTPPSYNKEVVAAPCQ